MLKIIHGNKLFTLVVLSAITIMITIAFVFWGIGPKDNPSVAFIAQVEDEKIMLDEFWRTYDNEYKRLRDQNRTPEDIEKINLKDRVLSSMVDRTVLLIAAEKSGITVTEKELQDTIINMPYFQKDGAFNDGVYKRALKLNRLTPKTFEDSVMQDLTITKISRIIGETAELSQEEQNILKSMSGANKEQLTQIFLSNKSNQTIQAYIESLKRKLSINIKKDLLS